MHSNHERQVKALQDHVSKAIQRCMPTHQFRSQLILATIGVALAAKDCERSTDLQDRRKANETYKRRKEILVGAVARLYEQAKERNIYNPEKHSTKHGEEATLRKTA